eukprot:242867_1
MCCLCYTGIINTSSSLQQCLHLTSTMPQINNNRVTVIAAVLCILFAIHFSLSIVLVYQLFIHGYVYLFGFSISSILLVYFVGICLVEYLIVSDVDEDIVNPFAVFILIAYFITGGRCDFDIKWFNQLNKDYICCRVTNFIIVMISLPLFILFAPFYSIADLVFDRRPSPRMGNTEFWINYQILSVALSTVMPVIIICLQIHSLPPSIHILCLILVFVGVLYFIIILFFGCDLLHRNNHKYWFVLPFMIIIETFLVLSIICITSLMTHLNAVQDILAMICLINVFVPNLPFYKAFVLNRYTNRLQDNVAFAYVMEDDDSMKQIDKMFCILLCNAGADTLKQRAVEQYKFCQLHVDKIKWVLNKEAQMKQSFGMKMVWIMYWISSCVAVLSPLVWMVYLDNTSAIVMLCWLMLSLYLISIIGLCIGLHKTKLNVPLLWPNIDYHAIFQSKQSHQVLQSKAKQYYEQMPIIEAILTKFQMDIGMIVV